MRILRAVGIVPDAHSLEYLYLVQQSKRLALIQSLNEFSSQRMRDWPCIVFMAVLRFIDLARSNVLIRSMVNEHDLLQKIQATKQGEGP